MLFSFVTILKFTDKAVVADYIKYDLSIGDKPIEAQIKIHGQGYGHPVQ